MSILARDPVTGALTLIDSALPRDVALDLGAGAYEVLPVGDVIGSVNVLDVVFGTAPLVSGSATAGATLTVSGTATSAVAYEYQWLADGVLIPGATSDTYATDATADLGKTFTGQMRAQDARGRWTAYAASSNSITIPAATYTIPDGEWDSIEDPDDAETRQTYVTAAPTVPVPAGKKLRWYKGPTNPTDSSMFAFLSDMAGTGPYTADGVSTVAVGTVVYSRLAISNLDNTSPEWVTSIKNYTTSNVPSAPGTFTATNSTTVTGRVSLDPNNTAPAANGRPIIEYGYSQNGGAITAFATGGSATTARDVDFVGIDPIAVRLHARNVNGWSAGSASVSVTPPVVTGGTNIVAPEIESNFYGRSAYAVETGAWTGSVASFTIDLEQSNDGTTGWTTYAADVAESGEWPATTLDAKYVRAKVTPTVGSPAYSAVYLMKNSPTHVLSFTGDAVKYPMTAPLWDADLTTGGVWFSFMFYFSSGAAPGSGYVMSYGDSTSASRYVALHGNGGFGSFNGTAVSFPDFGGNPSVAQGQWFLVTQHWYKVGSVHYVKGWRNGTEILSNGTTSTLTLASASTWLSMYLGGRANTSTSAVPNLPMCCFMSGKGNPETFHAETYNGGKLRNSLDYNFATDPNGCTKNFGVAGYRVGSATFANADIPDVVGSAGTPTTVTGAPTWSDFGGTVLPPFVRSTGPSVPVKAANIKPLLCPAGTQQSVQYGYGKIINTALAATPWATATAYAKDTRVTQGGSTYICIVAHTSGTFATDLTAENWAIFTLNSLTHAGYTVGDRRFPAGSTALGDILPTATNGIWTCSTPGTITANVTCGKVVATPAAWAASTSYSIGNRRRTGTPEVWYECTAAHTSAATFDIDLAKGNWSFVYGTFNVVSETYEPQTMPATPRNATDHGGNGLICGYDPYPTPAAAGTTFASVAALASAIGAVGAGGYLCVNDLTDTGTSLNIPAGDYGGAVVEAKNLHGVNVDGITLDNVRNLTIRGFKGKFWGSGLTRGGVFYTGSDGVWLHHCYGTLFRFAAKTAGVSTIKVQNWQSPSDETAGGHLFQDFFEAILWKAAIGDSGPADYTDRLRWAWCDRMIAARVYVGDYGGLEPSEAHGDLIQILGVGAGGYFSGYLVDSAVIDQNPGDLEVGSQGGFFCDSGPKCRDLWLNNFVARNTIASSIYVSSAISNVAFENCFGPSLVVILPSSFPNSGYTEDCIRGAVGATMASAVGTEINTISLGSLGIPVTTPFPQFYVYPGSWRGLANPSAGYTTAGPATFIAELEAKRVALGI